MKNFYTLILIFFSLSAKGDYWTQLANYPGAGQELPVSFSIGNLGYVGCGDNANDFWEYNPGTNLWTQKASVPGALRRAGIGFTINDKGYVGTGDGPLNDFYEYDPVANSWTAIANMATARNFGQAFSIGNKGYAGGGNYLNDFWEFYPALNVWTQKSNLPFEWGHAAAFVIGDKGYFSTGIQFPGTILIDQTWQYDTTANVWTQRAPLPGGTRTDARGFTICEKGYVMSGGESPMYDDMWQYDAMLDQWIQKANVPIGPRDDGASFTIGTKGYFGLGQLSASANTNDFWEYTPDSACATGIEEIPNNNFQFTISPNPASEFIVCSLQFAAEKKVELAITNVEGKKVYSLQLETGNRKQETKIDVSNFPNGIYFVNVDDGKQKVVRKFVKE